MLIDGPMPIAELREARRHGREREVARLARIELVPGQRRRDACVGSGPPRVRACHGTVLRGLVVVDEYTVTLFRPPLAGRDCGGALLDLARERECRPTHFVERPPSVDANVDVHPARARSL